MKSFCFFIVSLDIPEEENSHCTLQPKIKPFVSLKTIKFKKDYSETIIARKYIADQERPITFWIGQTILFWVQTTQNLIDLLLHGILQQKML